MLDIHWHAGMLYYGMRTAHMPSESPLTVMHHSTTVINLLLAPLKLEHSTLNRLHRAKVVNVFSVFL